MDKTIVSSKIYFSRDTCNALLLLDADKIEPPFFLEVAENCLHKKREFHVTLVGTHEGFIFKKNFEEALNKDLFLAKLLDVFKNRVFEIQLHNKYFLLKKVYKLKFNTETRMSIVQEISFSGTSLQALYQDIYEATGINVKYSKFHITLYTKSTRNKNMLLGIGITSEDNFKKCLVKEIFPVS